MEGIYKNQIYITQLEDKDMRCGLDEKGREAYRTREHGIVYAIDGTQDFELGRVIVWVDKKRGYVSCHIVSIESNGGHEFGFKLDHDIVFFSHYTNGDCDLVY